MSPVAIPLLNHRADVAFTPTVRQVNHDEATRDHVRLVNSNEVVVRQEVADPLAADVGKIDAKVRKRAAWVLRQQRYFQAFLPRTPERRFMGGETHLYLGRQYRLRVLHNGTNSVKLNRQRFAMIAPADRPSALNSCMREITIPPNISRDQRDILLRRVQREISLALRRIHRLQAARDQSQPEGEDQPAC